MKKLVAITLLSLTGLSMGCNENSSTEPATIQNVPQPSEDIRANDSKTPPAGLDLTPTDLNGTNLVPPSPETQTT